MSSENINTNYSPNIQEIPPLLSILRLKEIRLNGPDAPDLCVGSYRETVPGAPKSVGWHGLDDPVGHDQHEGSATMQSFPYQFKGEHGGDARPREEINETLQKEVGDEVQDCVLSRISADWSDVVTPDDPSIESSIYSNDDDYSYAMDDYEGESQERFSLVYDKVEYSSWVREQEETSSTDYSR